MWITRLSIVNWTYSQTLILRLVSKTHKITNFDWKTLYLWKSNILLSVGYARNKCQYPTVSQNRKLFRWTLNYEWTFDLLFDFLRRALDSRKIAREITNRNPPEMLINSQMWTTSPQTEILLKTNLSCTSLRKTKRRSKWLSTTEFQRW